MKNYNEVANAYGMSDPMRTKFLKYMKARWGEPETEEGHCMVGYAQEWADRFIRGVEFGCSDRTGQAILNAMAKEGEIK